MLVRRGGLEAAGGLEPISDARIDDVALAGLLKRVASADTWLGFSTDVVSCRRYSRLAEVGDMVARSAYTQLRSSPVAPARTAAGLALLSLLPPPAPLAALLLSSP